MVELFASQMPRHVSRTLATAGFVFLMLPSRKTADQLRLALAAELRVNETDPAAIEDAVLAGERAIAALFPAAALGVRA